MKRYFLFSLFFTFKSFSFVGAGEKSVHITERAKQEILVNYLSNKELSLSELKQLVPNTTKVLLKRKTDDNFRYTLLVSSSSEKSIMLLINKLKRNPQINWVVQNTELVGDLREDQNQDQGQSGEPGRSEPMIARQHHHSVMKNFDAWLSDQNRAEIVVAVTDDGFDMNHEDLKANYFQNSAEIPGNGIDDDGNGYIDDISGWDFCDQNNNPQAPSGGSHGTHVAGIIAAIGDNGLGVSGVAPKVKIMPLRWYGYPSCGLDMARVVETYTYAVDNGAKIINTSYNVDSMAANPAYQEVVEYIVENDVLLFNSAGNNRALNPRRQNVEGVVFVAATHSDKQIDKRASFSNYGSLIDISAPGVEILATLPNSRYGNMSGTSMAAPNAAAVAALIWANYPTENSLQIMSRLYSSAQDITKENTSTELLKMGSGRVDSFFALRNSVPAPRILGMVDLQNNRLSSGTQRLFLKLSSLLDFTGLTPFTISLLSAGRDGRFGTADDVDIALNLKNDKTQPGSSTMILESITPLKSGKYLLSIKSQDIFDYFGQNLDGNNNGQSGGDYQIEFSVI